ncbi:MAG: SDR family oxidoreductase [Gemmataceae bacterium]|nr:SDR family oxidoreductase [Gemmataceae bacterium]
MDGAKSRGVVVTGGGSGIGLAAAKKFLEAGDRVVISGRGGPRLKTALEALSAIHGSNGRIWAVQADLSTQNGAEALAQEALCRLGKVDILVNNAGLNLKERSVAELSTDRWREVLGGNLDSAFLTTQAFLPSFRAQKDGLIVYINSIAGIRGNPLGGAAYVAAKFALRGWATALAAEEKANGLRVTSIFPGDVNTPILEARPNPVSEEHKVAILQPEDVASAIFFVGSLPTRALIPELIIAPSQYTYI